MANNEETIIESTSGELLVPEEILPKRIYLLPIGSRPFFPAQVQPLIIPAGPWEETFTRVGKSAHPVIGLCWLEQPEDEDEIPASTAFPQVGTLARVHNINQEEGRLQFIAQGMRRFRIVQWLRRKPPFLVEVDYPEGASSEESNGTEVKAYALALINTIKELLPLNPLYSEELKHYLTRFSPNEPSALADFAAAITTAKGHELQEIIQTLPLLARMKKVLVLLQRELEVARLHSQIKEEVTRKASERQRDFFLREQLKIIQRELGIEKDDKTADQDEFRERLARCDPPAHVQTRFDDEIRKLSLLETGSPEYGVTRNYLDALTRVPWGRYSDDQLDLDHARKILDRDHAGLDDVKDHIIEFLAEGAFRNDLSGQILLLSGPPGVGKTSVGRSIAEALGRRFYRLSLGGMRDEAEIKGHRRTYIGAMPGKFVQALAEAGTQNPLILLDEIDKLGRSFQGDPGSALLETLDPEQNSTFLDHYLDLRVDLSKVLFICTANQLDTIPRPLLDRMEIIRLPGYTPDEKLDIARRHLMPRLLKRTGLKRRQVSMGLPVLRHIIDGYAREAGVRTLEKLLHRILRKAILELMRGEEKVTITTRNLDRYLGAPVFRKEKHLTGIGVVTGLAWTSLGGATLPVEAQRVPAKSPGFKLTGRLGGVMKESAQIAYSFVAANARALGADPAFFEQDQVHLHVPEGATPKDGPSAGITMATALLSLARAETPRKGVAMTGELTLTGKVFPVGGIREKIIAARRMGIREVILPEANRFDFEELKEPIREGLEVHFAASFREVADIMFG